jgi:serine/threonine protein kinase
MVHLDMKPGNIVMGAPPVLVDLSIARTVEQASRITSQTGTDAYKAPEQCDPARFGPIGPAADVWGLGVTLHEAITGRSPFARDRSRTSTQPFAQLEAAPPPLPADTPPGLADTLLRCLDRAPALRPTALEVGMALEPMIAATKRRSVLGMGRPRLR